MKKLLILVAGAYFIFSGSVMAQEDDTVKLVNRHKEYIKDVELSLLDYREKNKYSYHNGRHLKADRDKKLAVVRIKSVNGIQHKIPLKKETVRLVYAAGEESGLRGGQSFSGEMRTDLPEIVRGLSYIDLVFSIPDGVKPTELLIFDRSIYLGKKPKKDKNKEEDPEVVEEEK